MVIMYQVLSDSYVIHEYAYDKITKNEHEYIFIHMLAITYSFAIVQISISHKHINFLSCKLNTREHQLVYFL